jgi:hypothetical protein
MYTVKEPCPNPSKADVKDGCTEGNDAGVEIVLPLVVFFCAGTRLHILLLRGYSYSVCVPECNLLIQYMYVHALYLYSYIKISNTRPLLTTVPVGEVL